VHSDGYTNGASGVNLDVCRGGKEDPTTFFKDGVRKIDFVLVPILPKHIFPILHIFVRFSHKYV
jgi:hypothetical protein